MPLIAKYRLTGAALLSNLAPSSMPACSHVLQKRPHIPEKAQAVIRDWLASMPDMTE